jgi:transposase
MPFPSGKLRENSYPRQGCQRRRDTAQDQFIRNRYFGKERMYKLFVGIDVAKKTHVLAARNADGEPVKETLKFNNSLAGFSLAEQRIIESNLPKEEILIGFEVSGNFWESLYDYLHAKGYQVVLLSPYCTDKYRKMTGGKIKTDKIDAYAIAGYLRLNDLTPAHVAEGDTKRLRELTRMKSNLNNYAKKLMREGYALLHVIFPEFESHFANPFAIVARSILRKYPNAFALRKAKADDLVKIARKVQGNTFSEKKAQELIGTAKTSVATDRVVDTRSFNLGIILDQMEATEKSISAIGEEIAKILVKPIDENGRGIGKKLSTIPGVGVNTIATIVGELGDIDRFSNAKQVVKYFGLFPQHSESGVGKKANPPMAKCGSANARHAVYLASVACLKHNPDLKGVYDRKLAEGKSPVQALIVVCHKLIHIIYSMLKYDTTFDPKRLFTNRSVVATT